MLKSFKKLSKKRNTKKAVIILIVVFVMVLSLLISKSYAIYQNENEVQFINAKLRFPKASEVNYTTTNNNSIANVEQALNDLYKKVGEMYE